MNILRIFGIVAAIHAFALLLIFANPGCSSSVAKQDQAATAGAPAAPAAAAPAAPDSSPMIAAPLPASPAPASPDVAPAAAGGALYSPTRPGTAAAAALEAQPVTDVTPAATYAVGKGDSLWSIAKKNHLRVSELAKANNLKTGATLRPGQKLLIPAKAVESAPVEAAAPASAPAAPARAASSARTAGESFKYVVKQGETLGAIAHRFGVRTGDLATKNAISDPQKIRPGQELTIPGSGRTTGSRSSKAAAAATPARVEAPAPAAPAPAPDMNAAPPPTSDVPVIKIDSSPPGSNPADQPKSP